MLANRAVASAVLLILLAAGAASAQLRIAQWNITNWEASDVSTRGSAFQTSFYGVVPEPSAIAGQSFAPDVIIAEEIEQGSSQATGQSSVNAFRNLLNAACNCGNDWQAAPYVFNGGDDGAALFYRASKVAWISTTSLTENTGTGPDQAPRDTMRWRIRVFGYAGAPAELYIYGSHFKAGSTAADQLRRNPESTRIRADSDALPAGIGGFLIGADFNIQSSAQQAYQTLVQSGGPGQFVDPIRSPGNWNGSSAFRQIRTQEPSGQMDDRHDQILVSGSLLDHQGLSYIFTGTTITGANPFGIPIFSTSTWNDPAHTYRCWGNDGAHFDTGINTAPTNAQVGQAIADALVVTVGAAGTTGGHLPVYLDMKVPAKLGAPTGTIDLGNVVQGTPVNYALQITNAADVARFSKNGAGAGIDALTYSLSMTAGAFTVSGGSGPFDRSATAPPAQATTHTIALDTSSPGAKSGTLTVVTDDPDNPTRQIGFIANVQPSTGACCTPSTGACQFLPLSSCASPNTWNGAPSCTSPSNPCPQPPSGACCTPSNGACQLVIEIACTSPDTWNGAPSCTAPANPCPQPPTGACCNGTACTTRTQTECAGAWQGASVACGAPGNPTACCYANFDRMNGLTVSDVYVFLNTWFLGNPAADADNSGSLSTNDIFVFLNAWFAGCVGTQP